jgi:threonine dehydrogenase-like Zn-dependent dehydrogenase
MFEKELTLRFTIGDPAHDRERLLGLVASGRLDPTPVVTRRLALADAAEGYRVFDARETTKVVLRP